MEKISVIIPCYNESEVIESFDKAICKIAKIVKTNFEFIYINDGSKDNTLEIIKKLASKDKRIKYVSFSRNFGKEAGIYAGLKNASGDYAVIIDADLQHDPNLIVEMYNYIKNEGYDSVAVRRVDRKGEKIIRSFFSKNFYKIMKKLSKIEIVDGEMDYRMMSKKMYQSVLSLAEYNRFSKGIFSWVGFNTKWLEQENIERTVGTTKWSFIDLVFYSINGITSFSTVPLMFATTLGLVFLFVSFIILVSIIIASIIGNPISLLSGLSVIIFLVSGLMMLCLGIISEYFAKMYTEIKNRPIYIEKESNFDEKN